MKTQLVASQGLSELEATLVLLRIYRFYAEKFESCNKTCCGTLSARSKALVCGHSIAEAAVSNPGRQDGCLSVVSVVCSQVQVSALG